MNARLALAALLLTAILVGVVTARADYVEINPKAPTVNTDGPIVPAKVEPEPVEQMLVLPVKPERIPAEVEPAPEPEPTYTAEELELLALVIYQEAGGDACSDETRLRVGCVVLNRVEHPEFPATIYDVVTEERAYGELYWTGPVWPDRAEYECEAHAVARAYDIAKRVLEGERVLPEDVIFQSEFIMGEIVAHSDGMYFCR